MVLVMCSPVCGPLALKSAAPYSSGMRHAIAGISPSEAGMRAILPLLITLSISAPALALEPMPADGDWMCDVRDVLFRMTIEGETYLFTDPASPGGDLALYLDGVTYDIESGVLKDQIGLLQIQYGDEGGADNLSLSSADASIGWCFRPKP
jgi:hypothetical protein